MSSNPTDPAGRHTDGRPAPLPADLDQPLKAVSRPTAEWLNPEQLVADLQAEARSLGEQYHEPAGCHWGGRPHLGPCRDRSREAGEALTEIRTVLSRAETALKTLTGQIPLERHRQPKPPPTVGGMVDAGEPPVDDAHPRPFDDPDLTIMLDTLRQVIALLAPWRRAGRTVRWVQEDGPAQLVTPTQPPWFDDQGFGDEMTLGHQAVLGEVRQRLAAHFAHDPARQRTAVGVVDEFMREIIENERDGYQGGDESGMHRTRAKQLTEAFGGEWTRWESGPAGIPGGAMWARLAANADGRMVLTGLVLVGDGLTAESLRRVPVSVIERTTAEQAAGTEEEMRAELAELPALERGDRTPADFAELVASHYKVWARFTSNPVAGMSAGWGIKSGTVHAWVHDARKRGLLPEAERGKRRATGPNP